MLLFFSTTKNEIMHDDVTAKRTESLFSLSLPLFLKKHRHRRTKILWWKILLLLDDINGDVERKHEQVMKTLISLFTFLLPFTSSSLLFFFFFLPVLACSFTTKNIHRHTVCWEELKTFQDETGNNSCLQIWVRSLISSKQAKGGLIGIYVWNADVMNDIEQKVSERSKKLWWKSRM